MTATTHTTRESTIAERVLIGAAASVLGAIIGGIIFGPPGAALGAKLGGGIGATGS